MIQVTVIAEMAYLWNILRLPDVNSQSFILDQNPPLQQNQYQSRDLYTWISPHFLQQNPLMQLPITLILEPFLRKQFKFLSLRPKMNNDLQNMTLYQTKTTQTITCDINPLARRPNSQSLAQKKQDTSLPLQIQKEGFVKLKSFICNQGGGMPVFGFPLMAYQQKANHAELWEQLYRSVLESKANVQDSDRDEGHFDRRQSLLLQILNKQNKVQDLEAQMLRDFSNGTKFNRRTVRTEVNSCNRTRVVQSPEPEKSEQQENMNRIEEMTQGRQKEEADRVRELIRQIKMKDDKTAENLGTLMASQYKILRLGPETNEEIDFVEWASNLDRDHPIAKNYQNIRKTHFDKLRKERQIHQTRSHGKQTTSSFHSRNKSNKTSPNMQSIFTNDSSPLIQARTNQSRNDFNKTFNIKQGSTQDHLSFQNQGPKKWLANQHFQDSIYGLQSLKS